MRVAPQLRGRSTQDLLRMLKDGRAYVDGDTVVPTVQGASTFPLSNTFEGGSDTTLITTANSGGTSGNAFDAVTQSTSTETFSADHAHSGTLCMKGTQPATAVTTFVAWTGFGTLTTDVFGRFYLFMPAFPNAQMRVAIVRTAANASSAHISISTTGKISAQNAAGAALNTGTVSCATGQWIRIEFRVKSSTTAGEVEWWLYNNADSTTADETLLATGAVLGADSDAIRYGIGATTTAPSNYTAYLDDLAMDSAKIGPSGAAALPPIPVRNPLAEWLSRPRGDKLHALALQLIRPQVPAPVSAAQQFSYALTDTGLDMSGGDTIQMAAARPVVDTGLAVSDSIQTVAARQQPTDTGLTVSDSVAVKATRPITDTGLTVTDALASNRTRAISDTALSITDAIVMKASRLLTDTGLSISDALSGGRTFSRSLTDTALSISDSIVMRATRLLTDTGLSVSESIAMRATRALTDTALSISETLSRTSFGTITDTALSVSDSIRMLATRVLTDTGLSVSSTLVVQAARKLADTALSVTDSLASLRNRVLADTGLAVSDSIVMKATRPIATTGLNMSGDSIASFATRVRAITDNGVVFSDGGIVMHVTRPIVDTGLAVTGDSVSTGHGASVSLTDTGLSISSSIAIRVSRAQPTDTALTITDALAVRATRQMADTAIVMTDALSIRASRPITDTGLAVTDTIRTARARVLLDTALTIADSIVRQPTTFTRVLTDTGLHVVDVLVATKGSGALVLTPESTITMLPRPASTLALASRPSSTVSYTRAESTGAWRSEPVSSAPAETAEPRSTIRRN